MFRILSRIQDWWRAQWSREVSPEAARERVRRGADYLDDVDPDWYRRIDAETLELGDGEQCILGQMHGAFRLGLGRSHIINVSSAPRASLSPIAYGFKCVDAASEAERAADYRLLNAAWREAVRVRRANDPSIPTADPSASSGDSIPRVPSEPERARVGA